MGVKREICRLRLARFGAAAACFVVVLAAVSIMRQAAAANSPRTLIFVIDSSEGMAPYLAAVKGAVFATIEESKSGDTLGIVSFSDIPRRLIVKKISDKRDLKLVQKMLNTIEATGKSGDVAGGVARALEEIGRLGRRGDISRKGIVVVSSSQSPEESRPAQTLKNAAKESLKEVNRNQWYIQYCYLNGVRDRHIEAFVSSYLGFSYDVDSLLSDHDTGPVAELYSLLSAPRKLNPVKIRDLKGAILGKGPPNAEWIPLAVGASISEKTLLRVATSSRAVIELEGCGRLGLGPETRFTVMETRKNPVTDRGYFSTAMETGSVWVDLGRGAISTFELATPAARIELQGENAAVSYSEETGELTITSFSDPLSVRVSGKPGEPLKLGKNQSARIGPGQTLGKAFAAEAQWIEKRKSWQKALEKNVSLASLDFTVPELAFPDEAIKIGPIRSGETLSRDFTLQTFGISNLSDLKTDVATSLVLPEGLVLSTAIHKSKKPGTTILRLKVDGSSGFASEPLEIHTGSLRITPAPGSGVLFKIVRVPLTITTKGPVLPRSALFVGGGAILLLIIVAGAAFWRRTRETVSSRAHGVIGRLIVVNDPTGGRIGTINLEELSTKSSRLSLVVGKDKTSEVRLRHASVNPAHCTIEAYLVGGRLDTYIEPIEHATVKVDGEIIHSKTQLKDRTKIEIGNFVYQFEDTQMYKKVEVVRRNGKRISGILDATGMDSEGFRISPMDAVSPNERARIRHADIRYATFYRRVVNILSGTPRPMPKPDTMKRVELMFKRGNTITGYVQREYVEGRHKYVEILPLETGSDIDYTVVDYSAVVEKKIL